MEWIRGPAAESEVKGHRPGTQTVRTGIHCKVVSVQDGCSRLGHQASRECMIPSDAFRSAGGKRGGPVAGRGKLAGKVTRGCEAKRRRHPPPPVSLLNTRATLAPAPAEQSGRGAAAAAGAGR